MHIDSLRYFYEVAKANNISTVAKKSHISQSALSQQLLKLENKLNVKLLNRSNKGIRLTEEGKIFFKHCETIINTYNKMCEELVYFSQKKNYISIEAVESLSSTILPMAVSKLKNIHNYYTVNLNTIDYCSNTNLLNNISDIHICYKKHEEFDGLITKEIGKEEILLVSNLDFTKSKIKKEELFNIPLILNVKKKCLMNSIMDLLSCSELELEKLNVLYTTNSYISALNGALSSNAVTFMPKSIYKNYCACANIKVIEIEDVNITVPIYLSYLDKFYKNNSDFVKSLKTILKGFFN